MTMVKRLFVVWVIMMFLVSFTCSLTYLISQQSLRLGANDLPAQLAKDTAIHLDNGKSPASIVKSNSIDLAKSLDTFVIIYDNNKNLLASSGNINGSNPSYPKSVLDSVSKKGEVRVTWQPQKGLRFATIAMKNGQDYIVAGRSLYETENLIDQMGWLVLLAWSAALILITIALGIVYLFIKKVFPKERTPLL